jgi:hypothetical protein
MTRIRLTIGIALAALATSLALWPSAGKVHVALAAVCLPGDDDAQGRCRDLFVLYRGPAPDAALPESNLDVRVVEDLGEAPDPNPTGPVISYCDRSTCPAAVLALIKCGCRNRVDAGNCFYQPPGADAAVAAPYDTTLAPGTFAGAGCRRKFCQESGEAVGVQGLGYSFPSSCGGPP